MKTIQAMFVVVIFSMGNILMSTEEPKYKVIEKKDNVEIRMYEAYLIAETEVTASFEDAGNKAFRILFQYISGANTSRSEIPMTAPVAQTKGVSIPMTAPVAQTKEGSVFKVSFMVPSNFTEATVPVPSDPRVKIRLIPAQIMASVRSSGFWSSDKVSESETVMESFLAESPYAKNGPYIYARYNAPFVPFFMRRNELLVPVVKR